MKDVTINDLEWACKIIEGMPDEMFKEFLNKLMEKNIRIRYG